jgi:hypothetical protein
LGTSTEKFQASLLPSPRKKDWASWLPCSLISLADMWLYLAQEMLNYVTSNHKNGGYLFRVVINGGIVVYNGAFYWFAFFFLIAFFGFGVTS